jgi:hypothetical protein
MFAGADIPLQRLLSPVIQGWQWLPGDKTDQYNMAQIMLQSLIKKN